MPMKDSNSLLVHTFLLSHSSTIHSILSNLFVGKRNSRLMVSFSIPRNVSTSAGPSGDSELLTDSLEGRHHSWVNPGL